MSGKGERIFDPEGYLTRAEAATMIVNACGWNLDTIQYRENSDYMPLFADVVDAWYTPYVHVAYVHNVVSGTGDSSGYGFEWKYEPEQPVSRAQLVVMLDGTLTQEQAAQEYYACTYDTETNIRTEKGYLYGSEVLFDILEYESNEKEQLVRFTDYNAKGGVENNVDYLYDSEGRLQKEIYTNADGDAGFSGLSRGGAIYATNYKTLGLGSNVFFNNNVAGSFVDSSNACGGAIYLYYYGSNYTKLNIAGDARFHYNGLLELGEGTLKTYNGGVIYCGSVSSTVEIITIDAGENYVEFENNFAINGGGAIYGPTTIKSGDI